MQPTARYMDMERRAGGSFAEFYNANKDAVYQSVLLATRQPDRAEDAVAEAFARAYAKWATLQAHPAPRAWTVRTALNAFRSGWRIWRREVADVPDVVALSPPDDGLDPELAALVWRLPRRQRQVLALRVLADLDTARTAEALGISQKTVTVHLHRALTRLRAELEGSSREAFA